MAEPALALTLPELFLTVGVVPLAEPALALTLPALFLTVGVVPLAEPALAFAEPAEFLTVGVVPLAEPALALAEPALFFTVGVVPLAEPALALTLPTLFLTVVVEPLTLLALAALPVLPVTSWSCVDLVRSSPLPLFPPATSPRESELPSPASLWFAFPVVPAVPPLFVLDDEIACALPASLAWLFACVLLSAPD